MIQIAHAVAAGSLSKIWVNPSGHMQLPVLSEQSQQEMGNGILFMQGRNQ